jgi:hypothetical protein
MTHNKRSPRLAHLWVLFAVAWTLAVPASAEWKEKVLYSFQGGATDGALPAGGVVFDSAGNLYGATTQGFGFCPPAQCGSVFQLAPPPKQGDPWTETVLHVFTGNSNGDGDTPAGGLIIDSLGNLYGTTAYGGTGDCVLLGTKVGCGTVYEMMPPQTKGGKWTEVVLYSFPTSKQGYLPNGNLVFDNSGNLYGATIFGGGHGTTCDEFYQYCGAVFELSPPRKKGGKWTEKVLHGFRSGTDGANPNGGLVLNSKGAIYGTTYGGGNESGTCGAGGCGTAFQLSPPTQKGGAWTESVLHRFQSSANEARPAAGVTFDGKGCLYGTTVDTVFRLAPPLTKSGRWKETILYTFNNSAYDPAGALIFDTSGNLYGTTEYGNTFAGTVFRLEPPSVKGRNWTFGILHGFARSDGAQPAANLIFDDHGNLYSTTTEGGSGTGCSFHGCGTVFEINP